MLPTGCSLRRARWLRERRCTTTRFRLYDLELRLHHRKLAGEFWELADVFFQQCVQLLGWQLQQRG